MVPPGPLKGHPASLSALYLLILHLVHQEAGQITRCPLGQCSLDASHTRFWILPEFSISLCHLAPCSSLQFYHGQCQALRLVVNGFAALLPLPSHHWSLSIPHSALTILHSTITLQSPPAKLVGSYWTRGDDGRKQPSAIRTPTDRIHCVFTTLISTHAINHVCVLIS